MNGGDVTTNFLTVSEVAKYLRLHKQKVYRLSQNGDIPAYKFGREWRFKKERIDRWIEEHDMSRKTKR